MSDNPKDQEFAPINLEANDRIPMASNRQANTPSAAAAKSSNVYTSIVLLIALVACAGAGYLYNENLQSQKLLANNETRIKSLEDRLSATGEEMGNSTVELQVKLGELTTKTEELWEQMDKLWASAWRKNQEEIKTLNADLKTLKTDTNALVVDVEKRIADNKTTAANLTSRIETVNTKSNAQANEMLTVNAKLDEASQNNTKQTKAVRDTTEKLILLEKRNTTLLQQIQQLENKLEALANKMV